MLSTYELKLKSIEYRETVLQIIKKANAGHTGGSLSDELAELGATLLIETLPAWLSGQIQAEPQDEQFVTMTRLLKKQEGELDWSQSAQEIERQVRAFSPWPGTFSYGPRGQIKIITVEVADDPDIAEQNITAPGIILKHNRQVYVTTGQGIVRLVTVQPAGKNVMTAEALLNGQPDLLGTQLGKEES